MLYRFRNEKSRQIFLVQNWWTKSKKKRCKIGKFDPKTRKVGKTADFHHRNDSFIDLEKGKAGKFHRNIIH